MPADASADIASHGVTLRSNLFVTCTGLQAPRSPRRAMGAARRPGLFGVSGKQSTPPVEVADLLAESLWSPWPRCAMDVCPVRMIGGSWAKCTTVRC